MTIALSSQEAIRAQEADGAAHSVRDFTRVESFFVAFTAQVHFTRRGLALNAVLVIAFAIVTAMAVDALHAAQAADLLLEQTTLRFNGENTVGTGSAVIGSNR